MQDVRTMQLGQVVGFVEDFNKRQQKGKKDEKHKKSVKHYRFATPEESSAFLRG